MKFVTLDTVSQHGLSTESKTFRKASHTVWKIACESIFIYFILFSNGLIFFSFCFLFVFFLDGETVNSNITKQEGTAFFAKKSCAFIGSDNHVQIPVCLQTQA